MNKIVRNTILFSILVISFLMHARHFSKELVSIHVWRQTQTQSTIINFYEEDMNILNPRRNHRGDSEGIFRMEFPLMQWLVASTYKIFGKHLIISRVFMFILGLISILGIYQLLITLFKIEILAVIGAWAFTFSPSFFYYTINPLPDNLALCAAIWGLTLFFMWYHSSKRIYLLGAGLLFCISTLCKLPFIIYYIVPFVFFVEKILKKGVSKTIILQISSVFGFIVLPIAWYITVIPHWAGNMVLEGLAGYQSSAATLFDYIIHTAIITVPELMLNFGSVPFFFAGFYFLVKRKGVKNPKFKLILSLSIAVLLYYFFEANAIGKAHDYYLFPFYPLLFILVAYGAYHLFISVKKGVQGFTIFLLVLLPLFCYLRMEGRWNTDSPGFNKDLLIYKTELRDAVPKDALVVAGNDDSHFIFFYYIDKKGWAFNEDRLTAAKLQQMIAGGAAYIYTDSKTILNNEEIASNIDALILERGTIKVYKLKGATY